MLRFHKAQEQQNVPPPPGQMTDAEAQAVVALWAKQKDAPLLASVADVADALDTTPDEAARLLVQVRAENAQKEQARRGNRWRRMTAAALAIVGLGCVSVINFAPSGSATLTVEGSRTLPITAAQKPLMMSGVDTRTEVTLAYHPHSLLNFVLGPEWSTSQQEAVIVDSAGRRFSQFSTPGNGEIGIGDGWFRRTGYFTYSQSYFYPKAQLPAGPLTLHADMAADGQDAPIDVPLR